MQALENDKFSYLAIDYLSRFQTKWKNQKCEIKLDGFPLTGLMSNLKLQTNKRVMETLEF